MAPSNAHKPAESKQTGGIGRTRRHEALPFGVMLLFVIMAWCTVFLIRMTGPPNIYANDQQRPAAYVLDVLVNGEWIVQRDDTGDITSKPPLYTWLVSLTALGFREFNEFTLYLPGALAILGIALMAMLLGRHYFGATAGFIAGAGFVLSGPGFKQVHLARTDALFALTVFLSAWLLWRVLNRKTSWLWFWLMAALATLTKGPLVLVLVIGAAWGVRWKQRRDPYDDEVDHPEEKTGVPGWLRRTLQPGRGLAPGILLYITLTAGWFFLAWLSAGQALIDKMIGKELIGHALESGSGNRPFQGLYKPILYFLPRFLPWAPLTLFALYRVVRWPAERANVRQFEKFLAGYFALGMIFFSIVPHQRWDHLLPLLPAAILLAAREVTYLLPANWISRLIIWFPAVLAGVAAVGLPVIHFDRSRDVQRSLIARDAARYIGQAVEGDFPIMHVNATMGLQFFLGTMRERVTWSRGRDALLSEGAAFVVVREDDILYAMFPEGLPQGVHEIKRWELEGRSEPFLRIIGNRPALGVEEHQVFFRDVLRIETNGLKLERMTKRILEFEVTRGARPRIELLNTGDEARTFSVRIRDRDELIAEKTATLEPDEGLLLTP